MPPHPTLAINLSLRGEGRPTPPHPTLAINLSLRGEGRPTLSSPDTCHKSVFKRDR